MKLIMHAQNAPKMMHRIQYALVEEVRGEVIALSAVEGQLHKEGHSKQILVTKIVLRVLAKDIGHLQGARPVCATRDLMVLIALLVLKEPTKLELAPMLVNYVMHRDHGHRKQVLPVRAVLAMSVKPVLRALLALRVPTKILLDPVRVHLVWVKLPHLWVAH
jgi:hypothetical protein